MYPRLQAWSADDDYLGVGLENGHVKLVWNLGWMSRNDVMTPTRYADGRWHTVSVQR